MRGHHQDIALIPNPRDQCLPREHMTGETGLIGAKSPRLTAEGSVHDCLGYHAVGAQTMEALVV